MRNFEARQNLIRAALSYQASLLSDETDAHFDAQVGLNLDILDEAVKVYNDFIVLK